MLRGIDFEIASHEDSTSLEVATRAILQIWPTAVFADAFTGVRYGTFAAIPFGTIDELFVYRDAAAAVAWESRGAVAEALNTMVHVIRDPCWITVAFDSRDEVTESILTAVKNYLDNDIFLLAA